MTLLQKHLKAIGACGRAITNVPKGTPQEVWDNGTHPRWMIWWAGATAVNDQALVREVADALGLARFGTHEEEPVTCMIMRQRLKCPYDGRTDAPGTLSEAEGGV